MTLNERIEKLCKQRSYKFAPWEFKPWEVEGPCPYPPNSGSALCWPKALALRRKLIAELKTKKGKSDRTT